MPTESEIRPETALLSTGEDIRSFFDQRKGQVLIVHLWAEWSEGCKQMEEVVSELKKESPLTFLRVDAESCPEFCISHSIIAVPTFLFIKDDLLVGRVDGVHAAELTKKVRQIDSGVMVPILPAVTPSPTVQKSPKEELSTRLRALIKQTPCMVFIKGSPDQPRCGFSNQLVTLLKEWNVDFSSFDILTDPEVREGLKELSQWPTYPQLYLKGELLGGIDIVKEMAQTGEIQEMLPKKKDLKQRLESLIQKAPVMVFMKGSKEGPKCKFSRALMEILAQEKQVEFETFDILEDEQVRQGLKEYSNWPTYPQVYVKGELIGGIDIIKELKANGELESALKG